MIALNNNLGIAAGDRMKLKQAIIENFRSIKNCSIRFHELTAIVGENNSGKTGILRALNSVFNYELKLPTPSRCAEP
jgi:predicted ATP-dependent endonuclease of OLD family